jgi:hypothetical protein
MRKSACRYVDKLVKVWTTGGVECWVLIHVEVQTTRDAEFPRRMYVYNYRVFDRYNRPVASLAVLADNDADWRPTDFHSNPFGCEAGIRFPAVKLLDFVAHEAMLEASDNPFAPVVLAHLKARQTHGDPPARHAWKVRLVRNLYERGFSAKDVRELFRLIDWLMELPPPLQDVFCHDVVKIQEERRMPYVTSIERFGHRRGLRAGIDSKRRRIGTMYANCSRRLLLRNHNTFRFPTESERRNGPSPILRNRNVNRRCSPYSFAVSETLPHRPSRETDGEPFARRAKRVPSKK